jgi:hypothetical protein
MDIKYFDETINLSTIQWDEDSYLNNYQNQEEEKLSRYSFTHSYYPKVSNNIYNAIFNYYKNMNYSKKETEFISSLNDFTFNYNEYMKRNEEHIRFFVFMLFTLVYSYFIYKFLEFVVFSVINVFSIMYNFLSYNDDVDDNDVNDVNDVNNDNDIHDDNIVDNEIETIITEENYDSDYVPDSEDEEDEEEDQKDILEYYETDGNSGDENINTDAIENSEIDIDIQTKVKYEDERFEVYDIQTTMLDTVFKNVTMKQLASRCNKQSIRCIRQFHKCKSLNKVQLIMAFMHTHIFRYYNSKTASTIYFSLYNYLNCKMESYGFKKASYSLHKNLTPDDIDKYINYYFDITIIVDC